MLLEPWNFFTKIALGLILFSIGAIFDFSNLRRGKEHCAIDDVYRPGNSCCRFCHRARLDRNLADRQSPGTIAIEVSPIATILVLREANSEGPLTDTVYNIVALNVVCLLFGLAHICSPSFSGTESGAALLKVL